MPATTKPPPHAALIQLMQSGQSSPLVLVHHGTRLHAMQLGQGDAVKAHCAANVVEDVGINPQVEAS